MAQVKLINTDRLCKEIGVHPAPNCWEVVTTTEYFCDTCVRGIKNHIARTKFDTRAEAEAALERRVAYNKKRGWALRLR